MPEDSTPRPTRQAQRDARALLARELREQGLTHDAIAAALEVSLSAVKTYLVADSQKRRRPGASAVNALDERPGSVRFFSAIRCHMCRKDRKPSEHEQRRDVARLLCARELWSKGLTVDAIAAALGVSLRTATYYLSPKTPKA